MLAETHSDVGLFGLLFFIAMNNVRFFLVGIIYCLLHIVVVAASRVQNRAKN